MATGRLLLAFLLTLAATTASVASDREFTLRVTSYNIQGLPFPWLDQDRYREIGAIFRQMREEGTAPHIVVLQEAFDSRTEELNAAAGYPFVHRGPGPGGLQLSGGIVILSEFPIVSGARIVFRDCAAWDCYARKGAQHVRLEVPGVPQAIDLFNTHMNSDPDMDFWTALEATRAARLDQVGETLNFIAERSNDGLPLLFPGDFNFYPGETDYMLFHFSSRVSDAADECLRLPDACTSSPDGDREWRESVDHQFYRDGTQVRVTPVLFRRSFGEEHRGRMLSDHTALDIHYRLSW